MRTCFFLSPTAGLWILSKLLRKGRFYGDWKSMLNAARPHKLGHTFSLGKRWINWAYPLLEVVAAGPIFLPFLIKKLENDVVRSITRCFFYGAYFSFFCGMVRCRHFHKTTTKREEVMKKGFLVIICTCLLMPAVGFAANMRDYIPAPPDTLLSMLYYHHISGDDLNVNGNKAADVDLSQNLFLLREVYYTKIGSIVADPQVILPFGNGSLEAGGIEQDSDGIGDLILLCTFWVVNNPESKTYVGLTPYFYLPTGEYDENQSFNMGANRYAFQGEVGFVKG
ncbi:MAG: transporter, partial [Verrucomicrobiae bacterium]|nr:transporter [Verrucomicrobiae bacterium]